MDEVPEEGKSRDILSVQEVQLPLSSFRLIKTSKQANCTGSGARL